MAEYINPRVDWAFKRIFGSDDTKECLITFLNGVFEGEFVIKDVKFLKTEQTRHQKKERGVIFDVMCATDDGRRIIVEMQKKEQQYFVDRALFYSSKAIVEQAKQGEWDFHLSPIYTVCFMDFIAEEGIPYQFRTDISLGLLNKSVVSSQDPEKKKASMHKTLKMPGLRYGFEKIRIVFLQLPLFEKKEPECMDIFDCWIYVLNNMEHLKEIPFLDKYPVFRKLAEIGDLRKLTAEEREYYDEDIKIMRDLYATDKWEKIKRRREYEKFQKEREKFQREMEQAQREMEQAQREMEQAQREKDQAQIEKEQAQREKDQAQIEKEQAVEEARTKSLAIARNLLSMGMSPEQVAQGTQLPLETILSLANKA